MSGVYRKEVLRLGEDLNTNWNAWETRQRVGEWVYSKVRDYHEVRCAFFGRKLHSRMPLVPTPARFKLLQACAQWHSSRASTASYRFTLQIAPKY